MKWITLRTWSYSIIQGICMITIGAWLLNVKVMP